LFFLVIVVHHIDSTIPHYRAKAATKALQKAYPDLYLYEDTPIFQALWRIASKCFIVEKRKNQKQEDVYVFVD
jgi:fatty acid desaturase